MKKVLMKGNEAIALAAIKGGCEAFLVIQLHLKMNCLNI